MPDPNLLQAATELAALSRRELWVRYFALGGTASPGAVVQHISSGGLLDDDQHDLLVHALNERFAELDLDHPVPYRHPEMPVAATTLPDEEDVGPPPPETSSTWPAPRDLPK